MARVNNPILFMTTSPRSPEKMIPEIDLLIKNFTGQPWNENNQRKFMEILREEDFFHGKGNNNPAFSARDRINRGPQSLGFVTLKPFINITPAGKMLLSSRRKDEVFLRQLLKFQVPSPYHRPTEHAGKFWIKPYLEILRLIRTLGTLKFDELQIFGMQLTDWHNFPTIVSKIENFRTQKLQNKGRYAIFKKASLDHELKGIYANRIESGQTKTRESRDASLGYFLNTEGHNMRDYADACLRYLRITGLINVSQVGRSLSIVPEMKADVDYILETVGRDPVFVDDKEKYVAYLGDEQIPTLLTDNRKQLIYKIKTEFPNVAIGNNLKTEKLKDLLADNLEAKQKRNITQEIADIKDYKLYDDIQNIFDQISTGDLLQKSLMLEWNTWRAMTMLDGGSIKANLIFDDYGKPMSTAAANKADIICDYGDFYVIVEVTMQTGQKQYENEGEPVVRHLGKLRVGSGKPCYCLFIAPAINDTCVSYFFGLHNLYLRNYGGKSVIVPLPLQVFQKMLEDSYKASYTPAPSKVKNFFEYSQQLAESGCDEMKWYEGMKERATNWL